MLIHFYGYGCFAGHPEHFWDVPQTAQLFHLAKIQIVDYIYSEGNLRHQFPSRLMYECSFCLSKFCVRVNRK